MRLARHVGLAGERPRRGADYPQPGSSVVGVGVGSVAFTTGAPQPGSSACAVAPMPTTVVIENSTLAMVLITLCPTSVPFRVDHTSNVCAFA